MSVKSVAVSVTTTPTLLGTVSSATRETRRAFELYNNGTVPVYYGGADVSPANGVPVAAGTSRTVSSDTDNALTAAQPFYAVVLAGTADIRLVQVYN